MTLELNKEQLLILRDLLMTEVEYLMSDAIPSAELNDSKMGKKDCVNLKNALVQTQNVLDQVSENINFNN